MRAAWPGGGAGRGLGFWGGKRENFPGMEARFGILGENGEFPRDLGFWGKKGGEREKRGNFSGMEAGFGIWDLGGKGGNLG